jgi:hypothetical protein
LKFRSQENGLHWGKIQLFIKQGRMNRNRMSVIFAVGLAVVGLGVQASNAQSSRARRTLPTRNGTSIAANEKYVYVVKGNTLYKFDARNLNLVRQASFPAASKPSFARRSQRTAWPRRSRPISSLRVRPQMRPHVRVSRKNRSSETTLPP